MDDVSLNVGDVVQLRSGDGPQMVVVDIRPNAPTLNCCWFDANLHMQTAYVDARCLLKKRKP